MLFSSFLHVFAYLRSGAMVDDRYSLWWEKKTIEELVIINYYELYVTFVEKCYIKVPRRAHSNILESPEIREFGRGEGW